jgi:hypothetical protein
MPIFERGQGKPQTREILDIIFDMLSTDVPEDKILNMLKQMDLSDEEAQKTLSVAKQKYEALVQSSLSTAVDKLLAKEKEELLERVDSKVAAMKHDMLLKMDMSSPDLEKYIDKRMAPVLSELNSLKGDVFSTKVELNNRLKGLESKSGKDEKRSTDILIPVILMIVGIFIMFFGANSVRDLLMNFEVASLTDIFLYMIVIIIGIVFIIVGFQKYPRETKEYQLSGLEYAK